MHKRQWIITENREKITTTIIKGEWKTLNSIIKSAWSKFKVKAKEREK